MKTLLLIRHAKAEWEEPGQKDIARSLSEHGLKQAHFIAHSIAAKDMIPDMVFSSSAKRTIMTTQILLNEMSCSLEQVIYADDLYLAEPEILLRYARQADDDIQTLALVEHNPGLSEFASQLLREPSPVYDMPTAAVIGISWPVKHWQDIATGTGTLATYLKPEL